MTQADWLIGREIMGPAAGPLGYTCIRNLADPADSNALAAQPAHYRDYHNGMDPHRSSGIPNLAFHRAAMAIGGRSWEKAGMIWYRALTGFPPSPQMNIGDFANRTRSLARTLYPTQPAIAQAVDKGWRHVGR